MVRLKNFLSNPIVLIWVVVLVILIPILKPGFFSVHDETHIVDVYQMLRSLEVGGFPPRFAPDFNFSLGHPYFNFYYHLPFYITSIFYYLGFSMTDSFKYMMGLSVIIASSGFYFFLRNHVGKIAAIFGALIYILSPYFAVDLYVRGAFGELFILALFPWAGFFLYKYLTKPTFLNLALSAFSIFLISISHNVLLPFIYTLLFLYGIINLIIHHKKPLNYLKTFLPFLLGISLASYYLLPAFAEVRFISNYEQFNIADNFPFVKQLIIPNWGYGPSIWGSLDDISFDIGSVNLILLLISFIIFKLAKKEIKVLLIFFWAVFGLAVILMNSRTLFFWESIRFLRLVQFPWRMLILTTITTSFIAALTIQLTQERYKKTAPLILIIILALLAGLNFWHYHPSEYKKVSDERYLQVYFANRTLEGSGERNNLSPEYLNFTEDFIPPTVWQNKRPTKILDEVSLATNSGQISFQKNGLSYNINYQTPQDNKVVVAKAYFPGWEINSSENLYVDPYSEYGIMAVAVPPGSGSFQLEFKNTLVRTIANLISASAALLILVLLVYPTIRRKND